MAARDWLSKWIYHPEWFTLIFRFYFKLVFSCRYVHVFVGFCNYNDFGLNILLKIPFNFFEVSNHIIFKEHRFICRLDDWRRFNRYFSINTQAQYYNCPFLIFVFFILDLILSRTWHCRFLTTHGSGLRRARSQHGCWKVRHCGRDDRRRLSGNTTGHAWSL